MLDLFSRLAVGWSMSADREAALLMDALMTAVCSCGKANALLHHLDQGSQYMRSARTINKAFALTLFGLAVWMLLS